MKMKETCIKIIKKLKLNNLLKNLSPLFLTKQSNIVTEEEYASACAILSNYCKDEGKSCIVAKPDNKKEYDLDVIIPCYNVESFVKECIESVRKQMDSYKVRVIIIDDGATDSTGAIVDVYRDMPDFVVLHQENKGLSYTRNRALSMINAKYVAFLDSDDVLAEGSIEALLAMAEKTQADIVVGGYHVMATDGKLLGYRKTQEGIIENKGDIQGFPWGKVYKAELFEGVGFPEKYWFEDTLMRHIVFMRATTIYGVDKAVYHYRVNPHGISSSSRYNPKCLDTIYVYQSLQNDQKKLGIVCGQDEYEEFLRHVGLSMRRMAFLPSKIEKAAFIVWCHYKREHWPQKTRDKELMMLELAMERKAYRACWINAVLR